MWAEKVNVNVVILPMLGTELAPPVWTCTPALGLQLADTQTHCLCTAVWSTDSQMGLSLEGLY